VRRSLSWVRIGAAIVVLGLVVFFIASAAAGSFPFSSPASKGSDSAGQSPATPRPSTAPSTTASSPASGSKPGLSLQQMAGQRVIFSYHGLNPPAGLLTLIEHGEVGGVIFFGHNISSLAQITRVISELEQANASPLNPVRAPLLLMTDQEGGIVRRMPGAPYLSERQIGESADPAAAATAAGTSAGLNLRGVGMTVNLAPVLDVYRQPGDFDDQFGRSYSTNPEVVGQLGADFITAQQRTRVAAAAKHFPGLGPAAKGQNTDKRPVTLNVSVTAIRNTDEVPYKAAIAAGVRLVMLSWAVYPALAPGRPAGLSRVIVGGELRQRLGFNGVTVTDALEAGALKKFGPIQNRALLAAQAGMDLLLCSAQNFAEGEQASAALVQGYQDGRLGHPAFAAALKRVLALRASAGS
jgi:beta-N-acetylhexosaminidase